MNKKQLVLSRMKSKPSVKSLGFDKKELMGVAASIADNLTSDEEASEEEINAEIDKAIDAVIPYLQLAQSQASRVIDSFKKKQELNEDGDDLDDDGDDKQTPKSQKAKQTTTKKTEENDAMKQVLDMLTKMQGEITSLKGEKVADQRKQRLETLLKDTGAFGARTMKSFAKMSFDSEDEFEEFFSDVENDLKDFNKERTNAGLTSLGSLPGSKPKKVKDEPYSDDEITSLAEKM